MWYIWTTQPVDRDRGVVNRLAGELPLVGVSSAITAIELISCYYGQGSPYCCVDRTYCRLWRCCQAQRCKEANRPSFGLRSQQ